MGNHSYTIHFVYIVTKVRILTGQFLVNFGRLRKYNRTRILRSQLFDLRNKKDNMSIKPLQVKNISSRNPWNSRNRPTCSTRKSVSCVDWATMVRQKEKPVYSSCLFSVFHVLRWKIQDRND